MKQELYNIKDKIINRVIVLSSIYIIPLFMLSLIQVPNAGFKINNLFNAIQVISILVLLIVHKKLSVNLKTHFISIVFLLVGLTGYSLVYIASVFYFCFLSILLPGILLGKKQAFIYLLVSAVAFLTIGLLFTFKIITPQENLSTYIFTPFYIILRVSAIVYIAFVMIYTLSEFYNHLFNTFKIKELKEKEIKQSEQFIRLIGDNLPKGMIYQVQLNEKDNTRKFTYLSGGVKKLYGLEAEQVLENAHLLYSLVLEDDLNYVIEQESSALKNMVPFNVEIRFKSSDNTIHWHLLSSTPYRISEDIVSFDGIDIDITEQKNYEIQLIKAKEKAEESEKRIRTMFSTANTGFVIIDPTGMILEWNNTFIDNFGYSTDEFLQLNTRDITHPDDRSNSINHLKDLITGKINNFRIRKRFVRKDNSIMWADLFASPLLKGDNVYAILGVVNDITEQKDYENQLIKAKESAEENAIEIRAAHEELRATTDALKENYFALEKANEASEEKENNLRIITEQTSEGITVADMNGKYVFVNKTFCKMSGYSKEELLKMTVFDMVTPERLAEVKSGYGVNNIKGNVRYAELRRKDGSVYQTEIIGTYIVMNREKLILGCIRDISEIIENQNELIAAKEKAEESDRLKTAFLQNISHEIRTPMNGILGFSQLLSLRLEGDGKTKEYIDIIISSGEQLLSIVDDVLSISKIETGQVGLDKKEMNVIELMNSIFPVFEIKAQNKNITLIKNIEIEVNQGIVIQDVNKIRQVLSNLITNAIKYTKDGNVEYGCSIQGSNLHFYVKDSGKGIANDKIDKVFDRFSQFYKPIVETQGGVGLGLSISKGLVDIMGGKIWVESTVGVGSTFFFAIPLEESVNKIDEFDAKLLLEKYTDVDLSAFTILVVEDDITNQKVIEYLLLDSHPKLIKAFNGKDAIAKFELNKTIDLVLMDIKMPIMNGYEAALEIKNIRPGVPIIAQTAFAFDESKEAFYDARFDNYLVKPIKKEKLLHSICNVLNIE